MPSEWNISPPLDDTSGDRAMQIKPIKEKNATTIKRRNKGTGLSHDKELLSENSGSNNKIARGVAGAMALLSKSWTSTNLVKSKAWVSSNT